MKKNNSKLIFNMKKVIFYIFTFLSLPFVMAQELNCNFIEVKINSGIPVGSCGKWNSIYLTEYGLICKTYSSKNTELFEEIEPMYLFIAFDESNVEKVMQLQKFILNNLTEDKITKLQQGVKSYVNDEGDSVNTFITTNHLFLTRIYFTNVKDKQSWYCRYRAYNSKINTFIQLINDIITDDRFHIEQFKRVR